jgi:hypothetical protein
MLLRFRWRPFMRMLAVIVAFLLVLSVAGKAIAFSGRPMRWSVSVLVQRFDVDHEMSVPTWFSTSLLLVSAALLLSVAVATRAAGQRWWRHWAGLGALFLLLSIDEVTDLHTTPIIPRDAAAQVSPYLYLSWVIPAALFLLGLVALYLPFLRSIPRRTRWGMIVAGAVFVGGAMGVEAIGAAHILAYGYTNFTMALLVTLEEGMEMLGVLILLSTLFHHLETQLGVGLQLGAARPGNRARPDVLPASHQSGQPGESLGRGRERGRRLTEGEADESAA